MAPKKRPDADRLPISQRIDSRMDNPKRRTARPTDWAIKGELFLNCSCQVWCPCVVSLGQHPPTDGDCKAWMAIAIDEEGADEAIAKRRDKSLESVGIRVIRIKSKDILENMDGVLARITAGMRMRIGDKQEARRAHRENSRPKRGGYDRRERN